MSDEKTIRRLDSARRSLRAFSLIELMVVIVTVAALMALLLPSLLKAREQTKLVVCASNLRNIGVAIHAYSHDYDDAIPFGPEGRPVTGSNFYTVTGNVTSLLSLEDGDPVGLGLLLQSYVAEQPKVFFCPGADQHTDAGEQLALVGVKQAQSDYYYRHASVALLVGTPDLSHTRLSGLGKNRNGNPIKALVKDVQFLAHPSLAAFQVVTRTNHGRRTSNILLADNQVIRQDNTDDSLTVDIGSYPYDALEKILKAFEKADEFW